MNTSPSATPRRVLLDGWRHGLPVLPGLLLVAFASSFHPYVLVVALLATLGLVTKLRPVSFTRIAGLLAGVTTGAAFAYAGIWWAFSNGA